MAGIILGRLGSALPILLIVSLITFAMIHLIPGDPAVAIAGLSATPEQVANIRHDLGLDQPLLTQLWRWYSGLLHGDLGRSILLGQPVMEVTALRLPVTLALSAYALVITLLIGLISGIVAALRQNTWVDQAAMLLFLQGHRGNGNEERPITATVRVSFVKGSGGQWLVDDLAVVTRPKLPTGEK